MRYNKTLLSSHSAASDPSICAGLLNNNEIGSQSQSGFSRGRGRAAPLSITAAAADQEVITSPELSSPSSLGSRGRHSAPRAQLMSLHCHRSSGCRCGEEGGTGVTRGYSHDWAQLNTKNTKLITTAASHTSLYSLLLCQKNRIKFQPCYSHFCTVVTILFFD